MKIHHVVRTMALGFFSFLVTIIGAGSFLNTVESVWATDACQGVTCDTLPESICDPGGFNVALTEFIPADGTNSGMATYTYEICSPPAGTCDIDPNKSCLDDVQCALNCVGPPSNKTCAGTSLACTTSADCVGSCDRECAVDSFRGLSHFDVFFPELGGLESCLSAENIVGGTCECTDGSSANCKVDSNIVLGDGSCFASDTPVAKCDNTTLEPGDCIKMTLNIAGEQTGLGLGAAVVVSKESTDCNESCLAGPSCEACDDPPTEGEECLTRTLGFWGTHPWITNNYVPVTVCGKSLGCNGLDDGKSDPSCEALSCNSVMEGLGSRPAELNTNQPYVAMVKQLTAAKLNLNATATLLGGATCGEFRYLDMPIDYWINYCEGLCGDDKKTITESGCIEALDAFNNSPDVIDGVTPAPFDRPPVDDFGNVSGADPTNFQLAQGHAKTNRLVIGKDIGANMCANP